MGVHAGSDALLAAYAGNSPVDAIYMGSDLVWPTTLPETFDGFTEHFLDRVNVASSSGVTFAVAAPTKDAGNPLFPPSGAHAGDTWDYDKLQVAVTKRGSSWLALYGGFTNPGSVYNGCYASSSDGLAFVKPNLGLVTYDATTDNNLLEGDEALVDGFFDGPTAKWVMLTDTQDGSGVGNIYTATTPRGPFVLAKSITPPGTLPEVKSLVRRADGRWVLYYVTGHFLEARSIKAQLSDSTDLAGTWTDKGLRLPSPASTNQFYGLGATLIGSLVYASVMRYNKTTEQIWLDLYSARDGLTLLAHKTNFVPLGTAGAWDDEMIIGGQKIAVDGDDWHVYYSGSPANHAATPPRDSRIGRATLGRGRAASVGTTGNVITANLAVAAGATMTVNANAAGGTLKIEVQNSAGTPLTGYAEADFDTISTDVFDAIPTWGGLPLPDNQTLRLKFVLSSATLHGYEISDASSQAPVVKVVDTFARADSASSLGIAETGQTWSGFNGTWGINSNQAYFPDTTVGIIGAAGVDAGVADCTVQVTIAVTTGSIAGNYGIAFRISDNNNYWRWIADDLNDRLYLQKRVAGTFTTVVQVDTAGIANGAVLKVVMSGSSIQCFHNGTLKASTTDAHNSTATNHGLNRSNHSGGTSKGDARWDDFSITSP